MFETCSKNKIIKMLYIHMRTKKLHSGDSDGSLTQNTVYIEHKIN